MPASIWWTASSATPVARWPRRWPSRGCSMPPPSRSPIASRARRPWGWRSPSSSAGPCRTSSSTPPVAGLVSSASTRRCGSCRSWAGSKVRCRDWWRCRRAAAPPSSRPGSRGSANRASGPIPRPSPLASTCPRRWGTFWCWTPSIAPRDAPSRWKMAPSSARSASSPRAKAASSARKGRPPSPPPAS